MDPYSQQENQDVENELCEIELNDQTKISCSDEENQNYENYSETVYSELHTTIFSASEINSKIRSLNLNQRQIFDFINNWAKSHVKVKCGTTSKQSTRFHLLLSGSGGCGKSHLIKTLCIDEISMASRKLFYQIHKRLNEIFSPGQDVPFGGKSVLVCGDLCQLPPVPAKPVFTLNYTETMEGFMSIDLWRKFRLAELDQVMRQDDQMFVNMLNKIREGEVSLTKMIHVIQVTYCIFFRKCPS